MDTQQNNAEDEMDSYEERKFEKELMEAYVKHDVLWKHPPGHTPSKEIEILQNQAWQTVATSLSRSMGRIYEVTTVKAKMLGLYNTLRLAYNAGTNGKKEPFDKSRLQNKKQLQLVWKCMEKIVPYTFWGGKEKDDITYFTKVKNEMAASTGYYDTRRPEHNYSLDGNPYNVIEDDDLSEISTPQGGNDGMMYTEPSSGTTTTSVMAHSTRRSLSSNVMRPNYNEIPAHCSNYSSTSQAPIDKRRRSGINAGMSVQQTYQGNNNMVPQSRFTVRNTDLSQQQYTQAQEFQDDNPEHRYESVDEEVSEDEMNAVNVTPTHLPAHHYSNQFCHASGNFKAAAGAQRSSGSTYSGGMGKQSTRIVAFNRQQVQEMRNRVLTKDFVHDPQLDEFLLAVRSQLLGLQNEKLIDLAKGKIYGIISETYLYKFKMQTKLNVPNFSTKKK